MEDKIAALKTTTPYILALGEDILHIDEYIVVVEGAVLLKVTSLTKALVTLFALYYVVNIAYPRLNSNTMLFLEKYMFKLPSTGQLTGAAVATISALDNLKV